MRIFILENCPHCQKARRYIKELCEENEEYKKIDIDFIDEVKDSEFAERFDYYYVPSFFDGDVKLHEGIIQKEEVKEIFERYLKEKNK